VYKDIDQITTIPMADIFADPTWNCRGSVAPIDVTELARDIEHSGLQQPIVIRPIDNNKYKYQIVTGHRRYTAFKVLKRDFIPCFINNDLTETDALVLNLNENIHRKDLNIMQEAHAIYKLKLEGFSINNVAEAINKSSGWVKIRFQLLELPEPIREAAAAGFITQNQIKDLHGIKDINKQMEAAKKIKSAKLRGDKAPVINRKPSKRNIIKPKSRDKEDIFWMQDHIRDAIGNNFGTRCLAWCAGTINDHEIFQDIEEIAIKADIPYSIPYELGNI